MGSELQVLVEDRSLGNQEMTLLSGVDASVVFMKYNTIPFPHPLSHHSQFDTLRVATSSRDAI